MPLVPALGRQRQADLCVLEASLVYRINSRIIKATHVWKNQKLKKLKKKERKREREKEREKEKRLSKQEAALLHGLCISSSLQVPALLEFLPWLLLMDYDLDM